MTAGQTATANAQLGMGTTVRGTITAGGAPVRDAWVVTYDPVLGDVAGFAWSGDGSYTMPVLGPTGIRINVVRDGLNRWHVDAPDFYHATIVAVPSSGTVTVNLTFS